MQRESGYGQNEQQKQPGGEGQIEPARALFGPDAAAVNRGHDVALILRVEADGAEALVDGFTNGWVFFHRTQPLSSS